MEEDKNAGVTGTIVLRPADPLPDVDLTCHAHLLPCSTNHYGPSFVSHYFKPRRPVWLWMDWASRRLSSEGESCGSSPYLFLKRIASQTDNVSGLEKENDPFSCSKGNHQFILDEQIGLRCKLCSFVKSTYQGYHAILEN